ncbi:MAG: tRNA (adenosine(37)-N6)-dimethylallyltransferase MiaA, partial [Planctomycetia bacterium]|nr:tRNA (adenosine(37)-N6)-dimethylallyltransferase MiaA [Planctomycetia bacterium]
VVEPWESFSTGRYVRLAESAIVEIRSRGCVPVISGGTPLYIKALLEGIFDGPPADWPLRERLRAEAQAAGTSALHRRLGEVDPAAAQRIHPNDLRRIVRALEVYEKTGRPISSQQGQFGTADKRHLAVMFGIERDRGELYRRIDERVDRMLTRGLEAEVRHLLALGQPLSREAKQALGYREMIDWIGEGGDFADIVELIKRRTRRFAKRQLTWLRRFEDLRWIRAEADTTPEALAGQIVRLWRAHADGGAGER